MCLLARNLTWFTRPFLLMRAWGLGMRLSGDEDSGDETKMRPGNETRMRPGNETRMRPGNETRMRPGDETNSSAC